MSLKDLAVNAFLALAEDTELLGLLEITTPQNMGAVKKQIIEDRYPSDLVNDALSRLCVYEMPSMETQNPLIERCFIHVDIYVTKDKNKKDKRILLIADRIILLLDNEKRRKLGKAPVETGVSLKYSHRLPNMPTDGDDWTKFGLVFTYDLINI